MATSQPKQLVYVFELLFCLSVFLFLFLFASLDCLLLAKLLAYSKQASETNHQTDQIDYLRLILDTFRLA